MSERDGVAAALRHRRRAAWRDLLAVAALLVPIAVLVARSLRLGPACAALHGNLDVRFVGYVLEWGYLHLQGAVAPEASLWSPPFFYPVPGVLAYSENLFAGYPFYFPLRRLGLDPASAMFVFHLMQRALTPVVTYLCLRSLRLGRWPSFVAAALFSWGWVRFFHSGHIQFSAGYPIPLFFTALYFAFHRRRPWALVLAAWTFVFAWYFSLNLAVFLTLATLALGVVQLVLPGGAAEAVRVLRTCGDFRRAHRARAVVVVLCLLAAALLVPSATIYLDVQAEAGPASPAQVRAYWGDALSWVRPPRQHLFLAGLRDVFPGPGGRSWEKNAFVGWLGLAALLLPVAGVVYKGHRIYSLWPRPLVAASGAGALLIAVFSSYGGTWLEAPFWFLHRHLPGLGGLRTPTRVAFVVSWFMAVCIAVYLQRLAGRRPRWRWPASIGLGLVLLAEGLAPLPRIVDRCEDEQIWRQTERHLCPQVPREDIGTLLFLPASIHSLRSVVQNSLAMQLSLSCDLNVVNGYSGRRPELLAPLLGAPPRDPPCSALREILDRVHARSGEGVLIHVDRGPPLAINGFPTEEVATCLEPCLAPPPFWRTEQPGRPADVLVTDPALSCKETPVGRSQSR